MSIMLRFTSTPHAKISSSLKPLASQQQAAAAERKAASDMESVRHGEVPSGLLRSFLQKHVKHIAENGTCQE